MGSCAAPSAKGDDKFITTDYLPMVPCWHFDVYHLLYIRVVILVYQLLYKEVCMKSDVQLNLRAKKESQRALIDAAAKSFINREPTSFLRWPARLRRT